MQYNEIKFWRAQYILMDNTVMCYGIIEGHSTYLVYSAFYPPVDEKYRVHFTLNYELPLDINNPKKTIDTFFKLLVLQ
jgi:hypothetical protein